MDLHDDLELGGLGGAHLHRVEPTFDRLRFIKTAAQSLAKWEAGTLAASGTTGSWLQNLQSSSKPIVSAAVAQIPVMVQRFQTAVVTDGKYASGLAKAGGDAGIKQAAAAKVGNYATGTASNSPGAAKMGTFLTKLIAYETANLPQIYAMPKGTIAAGKARVNAWIDIMAAGAGSF